MEKTFNAKKVLFFIIPFLMLFGMTSPMKQDKCFNTLTFPILSKILQFCERNDTLNCRFVHTSFDDNIKNEPCFSENIGKKTCPSFFPILKANVFSEEQFFIKLFNKKTRDHFEKKFPWEKTTGKILNISTKVSKKDLNKSLILFLKNILDKSKEYKLQSVSFQAEEPLKGKQKGETRFHTTLSYDCNFGLKYLELRDNLGHKEYLKILNNNKNLLIEKKGKTKYFRSTDLHHPVILDESKSTVYFDSYNDATSLFEVIVSNYRKKNVVKFYKKTIEFKNKKVKKVFYSYIHSSDIPYFQPIDYN